MPLEVRARRGLAHRDRPDDLAARERRKEPLLLRLAPVVKDVRGDDLRVEAEADAARVRPGDLLHHDDGVEAVRPCAAVLLGHRGAEEARLPGLRPHLAVDVALVLPVAVEGHDLLLEELAEGIAELLVVVGEEGAFDHGREASVGCEERYHMPGTSAFTRESHAFRCDRHDDSNGCAVDVDGCDVLTMQRHAFLEHRDVRSWRRVCRVAGWSAISRRSHDRVGERDGHSNERHDPM